MGRVVIVCYKAKENKENALFNLLKKHVQVLRQAELVSPMDPIFLKTQEQHFLEIFEWQSAEAIEKAHTLPEIRALWEEFEACCTFEQLNTLPESAQMFAEFDRLNL